MGVGTKDCVLQVWGVIVVENDHMLKLDLCLVLMALYSS